MYGLVISIILPTNSGAIPPPINKHLRRRNFSPIVASETKEFTMKNEVLVATGYCQRLWFDHLRPCDGLSLTVTHELNPNLPDWATDNAIGNANLRIAIADDLVVHVRRRRWFQRTGGRHHYHEDEGEYRVQYVISILYADKEITDPQNAVSFKLFQLDAKTFRLDLSGIYEEQSHFVQKEEDRGEHRSISFTSDGLVKITQDA